MKYCIHLIFLSFYFYNYTIQASHKNDDDSSIGTTGAVCLDYKSDKSWNSDISEESNAEICNILINIKKPRAKKLSKSLEQENLHTFFKKEEKIQPDEQSQDE